MKLTANDKHTFGIYILTIMAGLIVSGCATLIPTNTPSIDIKSFDPSKKFAVISIASLKSFEVEKGMSQMFKSPDAIPGANTQTLINNLAPHIIHVLGSSKHYTLLPEDIVLKGKAYRYLAEDEKTMRVLLSRKTMNVANGYKYIADEEKYSVLAPYLGVDGVIGITMQFAIFPSKSYFATAGSTLARGSYREMQYDAVQKMNELSESNLGKRSYSAVASISVIAYNNHGELIWKDSFVQEADPNDVDAIIELNTSGITNADFEKFQPSALKIGEQSVDALLARFDSMMAGNEISRMRSIK